jgi:hypothetical protein
MSKEETIRHLSFILENPTTCKSEVKRSILKQRPKLSGLNLNSIVIPEEGLEMPTVFIS